MSKSLIKNSLLISAGAIATLIGANANASADQITVESGDTVSEISEKHNSTVETISSINNLSNPDFILVGQVLETGNGSNNNNNAPLNNVVSNNDENKEEVVNVENVAPQNTSFVNEDGTVTVQAGDTISTIAERNGVSVETLIANNNGSDLVVVGQKLNIQNNVVNNSNVSADASQNVQETPVAPENSNNVDNGQNNNINNDQNNTVDNGQNNTVDNGQNNTVDNGQNNNANNNNNGNIVADDSLAGQYLAALNNLRTANGLSALTLDAGLNAKATQRAQSAAANGGVPTNHWQTHGEVVAWGTPGWYGPASTIDAWFNETNMTTNGMPAHRMWVMDVNVSSAGFGFVTSNGVEYIVGVNA